MEVSNKHDVSAYAHSSTPQKKSVIRFGEGDNLSPRTQWSDEELISARLNQPLSAPEGEWVNSFFEQLQSGSARNFNYAQFGRRDFDEDNSEILIGLFPNLPWDAKIDSRNLIFDDPFKWLTHTIEFCQERSNISLVIKAHPAESLRGTKESFYEWIIDNFGDDIGSNLITLSPETNIDQYKLIEKLDAGVVIDSTIGMEMTFWQTPAIVVGNAHYRNWGFTFDPDSIERYEEYLDQVHELEVSNDMINRCMRYVHLLHRDKCIPFEYHDYSTGKAEFNRVTHGDIQDDPHLDLIVNRIVAGKPVCLFP